MAFLQNKYTWAYSGKAPIAKNLVTRIIEILVFLLLLSFLFFLSLASFCGCSVFALSPFLDLSLFGAFSVLVSLGFFLFFLVSLSSLSSVLSLLRLYYTLGVSVARSFDTVFEYHWEGASLDVLTTGLPAPSIGLTRV